MRFFIGWDNAAKTIGFHSFYVGAALAAKGFLASSLSLALTDELMATPYSPASGGELGFRASYPNQLRMLGSF